PVLDRGEQRVLLRLVEAVDLVEEEDRRATRGAALPGAGDHLADLRPAGVDRRELLEGALGADGDDARDRRLPASRRPVEDGAVRLARFDRRPQRRSRLQQMGLAGELVEVARAHPHRERGVLGRDAGMRFVAASFEELVAHPDSASALALSSASSRLTYAWNL